MDTSLNGKKIETSEQTLPKQSSKSAAKPKKEREKKPEGPRIYIGPNLPGGKLAAYTVFRFELPAHVESLVERFPDLNKLIVPVSTMSQALDRVKTQGTAEYRAVKNLTAKGES